MDDFVTMRFTLEWLLFDSYLTFTPQLAAKYQNLHQHLYETLYAETDNIRQSMYMANSLSVFLFRVGLLALYPSEWLENILRAN